MFHSKLWFLIITILSGLVVLMLIFLSQTNKQFSGRLLQISPPPSLTPLEYSVISETPVPTSTPRPTPTPKPSPIILSSSQIEDLFTKYADTQSISRELLKSIAACESGFNPGARYGPYGGLYQFSEGTWILTRRKMNLDTDTALRFIPEEAIKTAAFKIATQGVYAWPFCSKR